MNNVINNFSLNIIIVSLLLRMTGIIFRPTSCLSKNGLGNGNKTVELILSLCVLYALVSLRKSGWPPNIPSRSRQNSIPSTVKYKVFKSKIWETDTTAEPYHKNRKNSFPPCPYTVTVLQKSIRSVLGCPNQG